MSKTAEDPATSAAATRRDALLLVFATGAVIGVLGGLIGLGGAEFRLPLLIGLFGFAALHAVIVNKAMSLIVVLTALPARLIALPYAEVTQHWTIAANLLTGSLAGAWLGDSAGNLRCPGHDRDRTGLGECRRRPRARHHGDCRHHENGPVRAPVSPPESAIPPNVDRRPDAVAVSAQLS
ncbi:TSUP family transporter [Nocardia sp. FBN12]|uniref:TSUP family transporter n=1 Tax=Nocardia sp. FBN12 TaxID=3419766 RepID=UPI003D086749